MRAIRAAQPPPRIRRCFVLHAPAAHVAEVMLGGEEGERWLARARGDRDPKAAFNLSVALRERGRGEEAEKMLEEAAAMDHPKACYNLARRRLDGGRIEVAMELMERSADLGDDRAAREARKISRRLKNEAIVRRQEEEVARKMEAVTVLEQPPPPEGGGEEEEEEEEEVDEGYGDNRNVRGKPTSKAIERVKAAVAARKKKREEEAARQGS